MGAKFNAGLRMRPLAVLIGVAVASGMFSRPANASCDTGTTSGITCTGTTTTTVTVGQGATLTVEQDASVAVTGPQTQAITVSGSGNSIVNRGTISSATTAIQFTGSGGPPTGNVINNYGTIQSQPDSSGNSQSVIGSATNAGLKFTNFDGGEVLGDLIFGAGTNELTLVSGSTVSGNVDGGPGTTSMFLVSNTSEPSIYAGNIKNIQTLQYAGEGLWTLSGNIAQNQNGTPMSIVVGEGSGLALTGATKVIGAVTIAPKASLQTSAQGLSGDITMSSSSSTATDSGVTFVQNDDATYAGKVLGAGSLNKKGSGVLTLSNSLNTYTGVTQIAEGTLAINSDGTLGSPTGVLQLAGGTLRLNNSGGITLSGGRQIVITAATGTIETTGGISTVSQSINGASGNNNAAFVKSGDGTLALTGSSTYRGGTTITGGTLQLGAGEDTGAIDGTVTVNAGAVFAFNRSDTALAFDKEISGAGMVAQLGSGTVALSHNNTYTGGTALNGGTLNIERDANLGDASGSLTFNGGTLRLNNNNGINLSANRQITITNPTGIINGTTGTIETVGGTSTLRQSITGSGKLIKSGDGTLVLTGNSVYAGGTTINGGTLQLGAGGATGSIPGDVSISEGAVLAFNRSDDALSVNGIISGDGMVVKEGLGTVTLASIASTYTGGTKLNAGTLIIGSDFNLGGASGSLTFNGGTLQLSSPVGITLAPGRQITISGTGTIGTLYGSTSKLSQSITGDGAFIKSGNGTLVLTGNSVYEGGTTINAGTLQLGDGGETGSILGDVSINSGAVFAFNRSNDTFVFSGIISGDGMVIKEGLGTATLSGTNTYTGGTALNVGTLSVGTDANLGAVSGSLTFGGGTLLNTAGFTMARDVTVLGAGGTFNTALALGHTGSLSGSGPLTKAGNGMLTLAGNNNYTGNVSVQSGTLMANSTLGGRVTVATGASLGGTGTISGISTIASGATLLGQQGQQLTFGTDLLLSSDSLISVALGAPETSGLFNVKGNLTLDGQLNITDLGGFGPGTYRLFNYDGTLDNQTLVIGDVPTGIDPKGIEVQVSKPQQVNLINTTGVTLHFWDGAGTTNANNNVVNGGNGTWNTGNTEWTKADGSVNGEWINGNFAVFEGQQGSVTVDNNGVSVSGMQFATDGYRVQGGPITLAHQDTIIRTGVGNADSASVATSTLIASELTGPGGLVKTDLGTLVLTGTNTYGIDADGTDTDADNTRILGGQLQLGDGGTSGSIIGNVATTHGTGLAFNRSDNLSFGGTISGAGSVTQLGDGQTTLTGENTYTGDTVISHGILQLGDGGETGSIVGNVTTSNNGALAFNRSNAVTFSNTMTGTGSLIQRGHGTTTLTGQNAYTGGTRITMGTLQLGDGGTTGSIRGNVDIDAGGALAFNRSDAQQFDGVFSGSGQIRQLGNGKTTLTANSAAYVGTTTIEHGTLAVNGSLYGGMNVDAGGRLQGTGTVFNLTNSGTVAPGNSIGTLTVAGNYVGSGGTLEMETVLGGDNSATDRLVIIGDTSGMTNVRVINDGGTGAQTVEGIKLIEVGGNSAGVFSLVGDYVIQGQQAVVAGAYAYTLQKNGLSTPDGDWYLRSSLDASPPTTPTNPTNPTTPTTPPSPTPPSRPIFQPGVALYEAYPSVLLGLNGLSTLQERVGNQYGRTGNSASPSEAAGQYTRSGSGDGAWARVQGVNSRFEPKHSTIGFTTHTDQYKIQLGVDHSLVDNNNGRLVGGLNAQYGNASSKVDSFYGKGRINADVYGLGSSLTWYGDKGFYVDAQANLNWFKSTLSSSTLGRGLAKDNDGTGYALSVETGKRIELGNGWGVTPQAQLQFSSVDFDSFTDPYGARVSMDSGDSLLGRLGVAADHQNVVHDANGKVAHRRSIYGIANLYYEMGNGTAVKVADRRVASSDDRLSGGLGAGATYSWNDDKYAVYGEVMAKTTLANFGESYSYSATVGWRMRY